MRKRTLVPVLALVTLALMTGRLAWLGTQTGPDPIASERPNATLVLAQGRKVVRCAVTTALSRESLWNTLTDYAHFPDTFPWFKIVQVRDEKDGVVALSGMATVLALNMEFATRIHHEKGTKDWRIYWHQGSQSVPVNQGSWTLSPLTGGGTQLTYELDVEPRGYPTWLVRGYVVNNIHYIVKALLKAAGERSSR